MIGTRIVCFWVVFIFGLSALLDQSARAEAGETPNQALIRAILAKDLGAVENSLSAGAEINSPEVIDSLIDFVVWGGVVKKEVSEVKSVLRFLHAKGLNLNAYRARELGGMQEARHRETLLTAVLRQTCSPAQTQIVRELLGLGADPELPWRVERTQEYNGSRSRVEEYHKPLGIVIGRPAGFGSTECNSQQESLLRERGAALSSAGTVDYSRTSRAIR